MTRGTIAVAAAAALLLASASIAGPYLDVEGADRRLDAVAADSLGTTKVFRVGESRGGRAIRGLRFGLPGAVPVEERPVLLLVAGLDADRRGGTAVALELIPLLQARAAGDEALAACLRRTAVEVVPLVNPDGLSMNLATNLRPVDSDRDGSMDEDGPRDLDRDGLITRMRVPDPTGGYVGSGEDPRLLVPAAPGDTQAPRWRLLPEGLDDDGDGEVGEDPPGGVSLDRNFAHGWKRHDRAAGPSCPSEPESRALAEHLLSRPVACVLVYGRHDNLSAVPAENKAGPREEPNGPLTGDLSWLKHVSGLFHEACAPGPGPGDTADGAFHQWAYYQRGIPAFSTPLIYPQVDGEEPGSEEARWLAWSDQALDGAGFVEWKPFDHPTLGKVEIGGFSPRLRTWPPGIDLSKIAERQAAFVSGLVRELPRPEWSVPKVRRVEEGVYEIRATLLCRGRLPLITAMTVQARAGMPARVTLDLPADRILQGGRETLVDRFDGGRRQLRWLVRAGAGRTFRIRAWTERGGIVEVEVTP